LKHSRGFSRENAKISKNRRENAIQINQGQVQKFGHATSRLGSFRRAHGPPGPKWGRDGSRKPGGGEALAAGAACPRFPPPNAALQRAPHQPAARRGGRRTAISNRARKTRLFSRQLKNAARGPLSFLFFGGIFRVIFCGTPGDFSGFSRDFRGFPRVCRGGNPRIAHGFQWISEDFRGFQRITEDFQWILGWGWGSAGQPASPRAPAPSPQTSGIH